MALAFILHSRLLDRQHACLRDLAVIGHGDRREAYSAGNVAMHNAGNPRSTGIEPGRTGACGLPPSVASANTLVGRRFATVDCSFRVATAASSYCLPSRRCSITMWPPVTTAAITGSQWLLRAFAAAAALTFLALSGPMLLPYEGPCACAGKQVVPGGLDSCGPSALCTARSSGRPCRIACDAGSEAESPLPPAPECNDEICGIPHTPP